MAEPLPKFDAPPVTEVVLGVQFAKLPNYSGAVAGWFWKKHLGPAWTSTRPAPRLEDQFERFGPERQPEFLGIRLMTAGESERTQIIRDGDDRMIQIQDTRFILNWRRGPGGYPSYSKLQDEFNESFGKFNAFAGEAELGAVQPNQWEVTYINVLEKGDLWDSPTDWVRIIPNLYSPPAWGVDPLETQNGEWKYVIGKDQGRLYVTIRHGRLVVEGPDTLFLSLTARGPLSSDHTLQNGLSIGHDSIVRTFTAMTSPELHKRWLRRI